MSNIFNFNIHIHNNFKIQYDDIESENEIINNDEIVYYNNDIDNNNDDIESENEIVYYDNEINNNNDESENEIEYETDTEIINNENEYETDNEIIYYDNEIDNNENGNVNDDESENEIDDDEYFQNFENLIKRYIYLEDSLKKNNIEALRIELNSIEETLSNDYEEIYYDYLISCKKNLENQIEKNLN